MTAGAEMLRLEGVTKRFPGVLALDDVSFDLRAGEVHVLLGENGAGKSTLIKLVSGAYRPDSGRILVDGQEVRLDGVAAAERHGIATIYQELLLAPNLSVEENVLLGRQPRRFGVVDRRELRRRAVAAMERIGLQIDPGVRVGELSLAQRQLVEIAKALSLDARVLVLDEPTAVLTGTEIDRLFGVMRDLRDAGVGLVFISHHLDEIREIGDRVTVLRDGRRVDEVPAGTGVEELVRLMVGRSIEQQYPRQAGPVGEPLLRVRGLTRAGVFTDVSFEARAGEVVGIAGLVGAGRTELARAVFGADPYDSGSVEVAGTELPGSDIAASLRAGLGLVPEDRKGQGLVLGGTVEENLGLVALRGATRLGLVDRGGLRARAGEMARQLQVRMAGLGQPVGTLSGGNQQKVVIGKWLLVSSRVLILDEPTRGVDVGAKVEIYELINALTRDGDAVVVISSELPEVLGMSDRVLVMAHGRIVGEVDPRAAGQDDVMALAVGEGVAARER